MPSQPKCTTCNTRLSNGDNFCLQCGAPAVPATKKKRPLGNRYIIIGTVAIAGLLLFFLSRPLFFRMLSLGSTALLIGTVTIMVITFRKAKTVSAVSLTISMLVSAFCLMIYSRLINADVSNLSSIMALCSGLVIGVGWSLTSRLLLTPKGVKRRGGIGYLIVWGGIFAMNQITSLVTGRPPRLAMVLLFMSSGLMIGHNLSLLMRSERLKARESSL